MNQSIYKQRKFAELIREILLILLLVLLCFQFIGAQGRIPTGSMIPTIEIGDRILQNKIPYYYKDPVRGEIVIFTLDNKSLVKRVVGMPGDEIDIRDNEIYVNGKRLDERHYLVEGMITEPSFYSDITYPFVVPEGEYFLLGDNRTDSEDGRYFGTIPRKDIFATTRVRVFPFKRMGKIE